MKDTLDKNIPIASRKNDITKILTVYGTEVQPRKRCSVCWQSRKKGSEFYQPGKSMPSGYSVCVTDYLLKKKYREEWKSSKNRICKSLRQFTAKYPNADYKFRQETHEKIFRNEGYDNFFDEIG